jgi:hypothetical protein
MQYPVCWQCETSVSAQMGKQGDTRRKAQSERGGRVSGERLGVVSQMSAYSTKWTESTLQRQNDVRLIEKVGCLSSSHPIAWQVGQILLWKSSRTSSTDPDDVEHSLKIGYTLAEIVIAWSFIMTAFFFAEFLRVSLCDLQDLCIDMLNKCRFFLGPRYKWVCSHLGKQRAGSGRGRSDRRSHRRWEECAGASANRDASYLVPPCLD